jgi:hypothetical protein
MHLPSTTKSYHAEYHITHDSACCYTASTPTPIHDVTQSHTQTTAFISSPGGGCRLWPIIRILASAARRRLDPRSRTTGAAWQRRRRLLLGCRGFDSASPGSGGVEQGCCGRPAARNNRAC